MSSNQTKYLNHDLENSAALLLGQSPFYAPEMMKRYYRTGCAHDHSQLDEVAAHIFLKNFVPVSKENFLSAVTELETSICDWSRSGSAFSSYLLAQAAMLSGGTFNGSKNEYHADDILNSPAASYPPALHDLATWILSADDVSDAQYEKAKGLLLTAAQAGFIPSENDYAALLLNECGPDVESGKLIRAAFEAAYMIGSGFGYYNVGLAYWYGLGAESEFEKAFDWFREARERRVVAADNMLGICYAVGRGVELDNQKALTYFEEAARKGSFAGSRNSARIHYQYLPKNFNRLRAISHLRNVVHNGQPRDFEDLCTLLLSANSDPGALRYELRSLVQIADTEEFSEALYNVGTRILWFDYEISLIFIEKAADMKSSDAFRFLSSLGHSR